MLTDQASSIAADASSSRSRSRSTRTSSVGRSVVDLARYPPAVGCGFAVENGAVAVEVPGREVPVADAFDVCGGEERVAEVPGSPVACPRA